LVVTGDIVRPKAVEVYGALLCRLHDQLAARSVPMVFAMAPSPAVIYPEDLPNWVPRGAPSEADLLLARTRACGVTAVDLRPALIAAKPGGSIYYHHDTHWTPKGALIAYNTLVQSRKTSPTSSTCLARQICPPKPWRRRT
jgi:alginate O-acetyltransferase complex protein AlgJ